MLCRSRLLPSATLRHTPTRWRHVNRLLLAGELIFIAQPIPRQRGHLNPAFKLSLPTFYWMSSDLTHPSPLFLSEELFLFLIAPLEFADALVVVVYCGCEDPFGAVLPDYKGVEVVFEDFGGDAGGADVAAVGQWSGGRSTRIVVACEALVGEV